VTNHVTMREKWREAFIIDFNVEGIAFPFNKNLVKNVFDKSMSSKMRA